MCLYRLIGCVTKNIKIQLATHEVMINGNCNVTGNHPK